MRPGILAAHMTGISDEEAGIRTGTDDGPSRSSERDEAIARMQTIAHLLDDSVRVPGTNFRVGLDPLLGLLPGAGDVAAAGLSLYIVFEAARLGVPVRTLIRMLLNIGVDALAGTVPLVGDLFDAAFKANRRNVELAQRALASETGSLGSTDPGIRQ